MKIYPRRFGQREAEVDLDTAVARVLDGSEYGSGTIETLRSSQQKTVEMIARLVQALSPRLSTTDIESILGYSFEVER